MLTDDNNALNSDEVSSHFLDPELTIQFDGGDYVLLLGDYIKHYTVGGLITEIMRLDPKTLRDIIPQCPHLDDAPTRENMVEVLGAFRQVAFDKYPPVTACMVLQEMLTTIVEWFDSSDSGREEEYSSIFRGLDAPEVKKYFFEGTDLTEIGRETVRQMLLSAAFHFSYTFVIAKYLFKDVLDPDRDATQEERNASIGRLLSLYTDLVFTQHIDYRIINIDGELSSVYTIHSTFSLLQFEIAQCIHKEVDFNKCPNCGHLFVPEGRSDIRYCNYPSPQNPDKTCREIGAQIARSNKEKSDVVTREYRKAYMRHKMNVKRHPGSREATDTLQALTSGMKDWRIRLADGSSTTEQFLEWISRF